MGSGGRLLPTSSVLIIVIINTHRESNPTTQLRQAWPGHIRDEREREDIS